MENRGIWLEQAEKDLNRSVRILFSTYFVVCPRYAFIILQGQMVTSSTGLYMAKRSYKEPCTAILGYTQLDKAKHSYTRLYTAIQSYTRPAIRGCTELYTAI